jgi:hypothetical protein
MQMDVAAILVMVMVVGMMVAPVPMRMAGPIGMNVFMLAVALAERRNCGRDARLQVEQRRLGVAFASACRSHHSTSSTSMLLMFNSPPLIR